MYVYEMLAVAAVLITAPDAQDRSKPRAAAEKPAVLRSEKPTRAPKAETPKAKPSKSAGFRANTGKKKKKSKKGATPLDRIVAKVQSYYDDTKDYRADFIQTYTRVALSKTSESRGQVKIKKPGKMRWDYSQPASKHFITDGKQLWIYEPEDEVVTIQRSFETSQLSTSLSFLVGEGSLADSFKIEIIGKPAATTQLELHPKSGATYKKLVLSVDSKSGQVVESTLHETAGNINNFRFKNVKTNLGFPDSDFTFEPPPNVEQNIVP